MQKRVLVLDNDPGVLDVMQEVLVYEGFEVDTFEETKDILLLIKQCNPDLLIIDYSLNDTNGGELCRMIKNSVFAHNLPVIIFSGYTKLLQSLAYYGCSAFITKPFDLSVMMDKVTELVARQPTNAY